LVPEGFINKAESVVGGRYVKHDEASLSVYSYDASRLSAMPDLVASPADEAEVAALLKLASDEGVPVVPRGAASGLTGGSVPVSGGMALSFERMSAILDIDTRNRHATVQPGVITADLHRAAEEAGLFYPPDPGSKRFCTIGGNIAENAGGMRAVKYGVTRDYVMGLRAALADGRIIRAGAGTAKGVVGYDLARLIVGSEGTLAAVTEATLRLVPRPEKVVTLRAYFPDEHGAGMAVSEVMASAVTPRCMEFMDRAALRVGSAHAGVPVPEYAGACLIIETDGSPEGAAREAELIRQIVSGHATDISEAASAGEAEGLWDLRRNLSQAQYRIAPDKINEDVVVPVSRVPDLLAKVRGISEKSGLDIVCFGHAGDGNIHVNVMTDLRDPDNQKAAKDAVGELFGIVLELGGTISGEHGVGLTKLPYIGMELSGPEMDVMKAIKRAFDPKGIMNPGKIFPG